MMTVVVVEMEVVVEVVVVVDVVGDANAIRNDKCIALCITQLLIPNMQTSVQTFRSRSQLTV